MDKINIRTAQEDDFRAISKLASECRPITSERTSIYHIFTKFFKNTIFIAENVQNENNFAVGFLIGFISQSNNEECYIHQLCVNSDHRNQKIAYKLIKKFIETVQISGCKKVYLISKPTNKKAINFYKKLGFLESVNKPNTIKIWDLNAFRDYDGLGEHMIIFQKVI